MHVAQWCLFTFVFFRMSGFLLVTEDFYSVVLLILLLPPLVICGYTGGFLHLCNAFAINCTVTQYPDRTVYSISDESRVSDIEASDCYYSWTSDSVIANHDHEQKIPELVMTNTVNDLVTYKCFDSVTFERGCRSEGKGCVAHCSINCTLDTLGLQKHEVQRGREKDGEGEKEREQEQGEPGVAVAVTVTVAVILGLVVLVGLCVLCYKHKAKISRTWSRRKFRCIYTSVKMQNVDPKAADVEAGN